MDADVLELIAIVARKAAAYRREYLALEKVGQPSGQPLLKALELETELVKLMRDESSRIDEINAGAK